MKNLPLAHVEISKKNLIHNIKELKSLTKKGTKIAVAIKGNAYGHGQNEIAKIINPYIDYCLVNSIEELELLRKVSQKKSFVIGYVQNNDLKKLVKLNIILALFSLNQLKELNKTAKKVKKIQEIHLPIDAYLGREGFLLENLPEILNEIKKCRNIKLTGAYAHFANIEDTNSFSHANKQVKKYLKTLKLIKKFGFQNIQTHISSTSGFLIYEKGKGIHNIVRLGIGVYGMWPAEHIKLFYKNKIKLKPVLSWKTKIAEIKILPKNHTIGYGLTYKTTKETKIAIIPQGYADGYDRGLSNKGEVLIGGTRCKILGRVSMNMIVADISHLNKVKEEDEVVLLGHQGNNEITAEELASKIDTINYEITTRLSSLLPRTLV